MIADTMVTITKIDAAKRQLRTAIRLWFEDADPVSIHTLAFAAYEIIHTISKKRSPSRSELIFDLPVPDERKKEFRMWVKSHANFFKHADRDGDATIDFRPALSETFLFCCIEGLLICGEWAGDEEQAFSWWHSLHESTVFTEEARKFYTDHIPIEILNVLQTLCKSEFLSGYIQVRNRAPQGTCSQPSILTDRDEPIA
jgi:hypothetical protein